jgi:hypothetical protein
MKPKIKRLSYEVQEPFKAWGTQIHIDLSIGYVLLIAGLVFTLSGNRSWEMKDPVKSHDVSSGTLSKYIGYTFHNCWKRLFSFYMRRMAP